MTDFLAQLLIFLKLVFFSETVVITNNPISIIDNYKIVLEKPLSAITSGAHIKIEIPNTFKIEPKKDLSLKYLKKLELRTKQTINSENVKISLYTKENKKINLFLEKGYLQMHKNSVGIIFSNSKEILKKDFYKIEIDTNILLERAQVFWINSKK